MPIREVCSHSELQSVVEALMEHSGENKSLKLYGKI